MLVKQTLVSRHAADCQADVLTCWVHATNSRCKASNDGCCQFNTGLTINNSSVRHPV